MKDLGKIVLHIPAREGSKRVPGKNLRLMCGKPMISYSTEAAIDSKITKHIFVNTDSKGIMDYIKGNYPAVSIYKREEDLANDQASSDQFNFDIINKLKPDTLIMINPVCPLIEAIDIINALEVYKKNNCDTLISSTSTKMQTFCEGRSININADESLAPSQINKLITTLNWAITIWDTKTFIERMNKNGYAVLGDNRLFFDIDIFKSVKVSEETDFIFAEKILKIKQKS
jgi:CMP-N,N'-diacetyllegionaminic acid synthase